MARKKDFYIPTMSLYHTGENKYYNPGEKVDLSHLHPTVIALLLERGFINGPTPVLPLTVLSGLTYKEAMLLAEKGVLELVDLLGKTTLELDLITGVGVECATLWHKQAYDFLATSEEDEELVLDTNEVLYDTSTDVEVSEEVMDG